MLVAAAAAPAQAAIRVVTGMAEATTRATRAGASLFDKMRLTLGNAED